jgi:hypothetical protein
MLAGLYPVRIPGSKNRSLPARFIFLLLLMHAGGCRVGSGRRGAGRFDA